jgi:uronate dehydrogenase
VTAHSEPCGAPLVVVTGAAGRIGRSLCTDLPGYGWRVRGFDRTAVDGGLTGDVRDPEALDAALAGAAAVVHLAGQPTEARWPVIREANIEGTLQVFEAARRNGVRRIVFASSNHATGFTPVAPELPVDGPPRPDTLYGVSKVFGEALGRYYVDRYGLQVACLRIGTFADRPLTSRALETWLSPGDCARLVDACLRAESLSYALLWGVSANTRRTWRLDEAYALGYRPRDDAEAFAAEITEGPNYPADRYVGGEFTGSEFGIDEVAGRSCADAPPAAGVFAQDRKRSDT